MDGRRVGGRQQRPEIAPPGAADRGQAFDREGAAMQAPDHRDNIVLAAGAQSHAHGDLVGLRAGDGEIHHVEAVGQGCRQRFGEGDDLGIGIPAILMHEAPGLFAQRLGQFRVGVAERQAHHARGKIQIFVAVDIDDGAAPAGLKNDARRVAPAQHMRGVARDQIFVRIGKIEMFFHLTSDAGLIRRAALPAPNYRRRHGAATW